MRAQVSQMSQETREALERRIRSRLSHADDSATDHDVSIVGGGVAALTLALEIRRARPTTRILVIEPNAHPVPEITHTVGESTVEVSAHYLRDRPGVGRPLELRTHSQDGPADVLLTRAKHRHRATDGTRKFLVRTAGDLPNRPRQAGERAQPTLPVGRASISPSAECVQWSSAPRTVRTRFIFRTVTQSRRPRHGGWLTRRAATGCCPGNWISSGPTSTIAMLPGFASQRRSTSADGATTRPGMGASSRVTVRCPPTT